MESDTNGPEAIDHDDVLLNNWRVSQLERLGIHAPLSEIYADRVDWHEIAGLVRQGCPPRLALRIIV